MCRLNRLTRKVLDERVDNTKWVVLRYPNNSMAQLANTSLEAFEDFYFNVCTLDYSKMDKAMDNLVELMNKTDKVRVTGKNTDLTFSIKGIPAIKCAGGCNIPDGEVYTAPVRESMNGIISYNTPSEERGFTFENIVFEIKDGKIIKAPHLVLCLRELYSLSGSLSSPQYYTQSPVFLHQDKPAFGHR